MNAYLQSFGCKVNCVETEGIAELLRERGWTILPEPDGADAIILNSCTVTASGDKRMLHALRKLRTACPDAVLVLTGCYVQAFPEAAAALPQADILVGTRNRSGIPERIENFLIDRRRIFSAEPYGKGELFEELPPGGGQEHTRAFLKIQDGCDRFCSYCIIPYARGRSRSCTVQSLTERARKLSDQGYREIVLCGINLACWGKEEGYTIADAADLCRCIGFERVRLGSLEPDGLGDAVLEKLAKNAAFCPQFHISLQSGCDRTLRAMHRHYTCGEYADLSVKIRSLFPDAALTTDIMTGFPAETEEDFKETYTFAEKMAFSKMHIFRYSRRPGTLADAMEQQVPENVKKARADRLGDLDRKMRQDFLESRIGRTLSVLFERERVPGFHIGHAPDFSTVLVPTEPGEGSFRGSLRSVTITAAQEDCLLGSCT